ncbi:MAG TPA: hypothetical protein VJQ49_06530 [Casimicrobiaceae bacterium]|nr:hypothetical protein [Casimicrobiaceae bacterium]
MKVSSFQRSTAAAACAFVLALVAGCAQMPVGPPVAAPSLAVGDHWQYRVVDYLHRSAVSQLDVEIVAIADGVADLNIVHTEEGQRSAWTDRIDAQGGLHAGVLGSAAPRRFAPPAALLSFPLAQGRTWRQSVPTFRSDIDLPDEILIYGDVQGRAPVAVPAGEFDAVQIYRVLQFDDAEFWRTRTIRRDQVWYAPQVKGVVREIRYAEYFEHGDNDSTAVYTERRMFELTSFRPGRA